MQYGGIRSNRCKTQTFKHACGNDGSWSLKAAQIPSLSSINIFTYEEFCYYDGNITF